MNKSMKHYRDRIVVRGGEKWIECNVILEGAVDRLLFSDINIKGDFICDNLGLSTLRGSPKTVSGLFSCGKNPIMDLEGSPESVGTYLDCNYSKYLRSFKGAPKKIGTNVYACFCGNIETLEGLDEFNLLITHRNTTKLLQNDDYYIQYSLMDKIRLWN